MAPPSNHAVAGDTLTPARTSRVDATGPPLPSSCLTSESGIAPRLDGTPHGAMTVVTEGEYGTVSSCLIGLPAQGMPVMKFAAGRPDEAPFAAVDLRPAGRS